MHYMSTTERAEAQVIADVLQRLFEGDSVQQVHVSEDFGRAAYIYTVPMADYRRILAVDEDYIDDTPDGFANRFAHFTDMGIHRALLTCSKETFLFLTSPGRLHEVPMSRIRSDKPWLDA